MYVLEIDRLELGDIVATSRRALVSKAIRWKTDSEFSHVLLYVGRGSLIHADGAGVHSDNLQRMLFIDEYEVRVFRCCASPEQLGHVCNAARREVGKQYSSTEAVRSIKLRESESPAQRDRQFCSRLIARCFADSGLALVKNPDYCYPEDLLSSTLLKQIDGIARRATVDEVDFASSANPLDEQKRSTNEFLANVRKISGVDVQTFEDAAKLVLARPDLDGAICEALKASKYLTLWNYDVNVNRWRYDYATFQALELPTETKKATAIREIELAKADVERYSQAVLVNDTYKSASNAEYFVLLGDLWVTLVDLHLRRGAVAKLVANSITT